MNFRTAFLIIMTTGFLGSCGESKSPDAITAPPSPGTSSSTPAEPEPVTMDSTQPPVEQSTEASGSPSAEQQPKNLAARRLAPEKIRNGEDVYRKNCASCHGPNGEAKPNWRTPDSNGRYPPPPLDGSAHAWHHSTETLQKMILDGSQDGAMPAWKDKLTNQQVEDVVVWIKSLWPDEIYDIWLKEIEPKLESK